MSKTKNLGLEFINLINRTKKELNINHSSSVNSSSSRKESVEFLIANLRKCPDWHHDANQEVIDAILSFATVIQEKVIAFTNATISNPNHIIFGRTPVMAVFCDSLEPVITKLYPKLSVGFFILKNAGLWPFRDGLMSTEVDLGQKANNLKQEINGYEIVFAEVLNTDPDSRLSTDIISAGNTLELLSATMSFINNAIPASPALNWCHFCFRRAELNSVYCNSHHSTLDDTAYKAGKRVFENLNDEAKKRKKRYQGLRLLLGDEPNFLVSNSTDNSIGSTLGLYLDADNYYALNSTDQEIFDLTLHGNWSIARSMWTKSIDKQLPFIAQILKNNNYACADSWESFVSNIFISLQDNTENVRHPFWILRILILAETWLDHEHLFADTRRTDTKKQIYELHAAGEKQVSIARRLAIDKSYVSKILKQR